MIKNYLSTVLLALICAFSLNELSAQDKKVTKKVIVIEKTVDDNGKVVSKKVVKEGAEADAYIKELELDGDIDIDIDVNESNSHVIKKQAFKVIKLDDDGNKETIEWNGEGEMPVEIKEMMEKEGITSEHSKSAFFFKSNEGNGEHDIEISLNDEDLSDEIKQLLKEENIEIAFSDDPKKAQLGVMFDVTEDNQKVIITEVVEKSAAEEGGLLEGDIIRKFDDTEITSSESLLKVVKSYKPGDKVRVAITRDGKKTYKDVVLKEAVNTFILKVDNKDHHWKEVEKDVEIIIEKKK